MSREETPPSLYSLCTIPLAAPCHFTYSGACILPCFSLISDEEPSHRGAPFPTLLRANAHTPAHLSPHSSAPMPPHQRSFPHTPPHQCPHTSAPLRHFTYSDACILPCFSLISAEELSLRSAPFPTLLRANAPTAAHLSPHSSAPMPPHQRSSPPFSL